MNICYHAPVRASSTLDLQKCLEECVYSKEMINTVLTMNYSSEQPLEWH